MSRGAEVDDVGFCFLEGSPSETWAACLRDTCFPVVFEGSSMVGTKESPLSCNVGCLIALGESPKRFCKRESLCFALLSRRRLTLCHLQMSSVLRPMFHLLSKK